MSSLADRIAPADPDNSTLRVTLYTGLALLCKGGEILSRVPAPETAFEAGDRERYQLLSTAEVALGWLVGQGVEDSVNALGRGSSLGDAAAVLEWTDKERERHFTTALADWREEV